MSGFHFKKMFCQAASNGGCYLGRHFGLCHRSFKTASYLPWNTIGWMRKGLLAVEVRSYSNTEKDAAKKPNVTKKDNINARKVIGHVGRIIPYKIIQVLNKDGEDMGKMLKRDVIRILEKENLKLVAVSQKADPPVYKMLTGKELHEEQLRLREQQKQSTSPAVRHDEYAEISLEGRADSSGAPATGSDVTTASKGPVQIKEMSFLASISQHDLDVKMKQLIHWIEKKHHIRITVLNSRNANGPDKLEVLQQMIESMAGSATCMVQPKERKDGRAMICVLRPLSDKELQRHQIGAPAPTEKTDTKETTEQDNN